MNQFMLEVYLTMLNLSVYRKSLKNIDHNCLNALNISFLKSMTMHLRIFKGALEITSDNMSSFLALIWNWRSRTPSYVL